MRSGHFRSACFSCFSCFSSRFASFRLSTFSSSFAMWRSAASSSDMRVRKVRSRPAHLLIHARERRLHGGKQCIGGPDFAARQPERARIEIATDRNHNPARGRSARKLSTSCGRRFATSAPGSGQSITFTAARARFRGHAFFVVGVLFRINPHERRPPAGCVPFCGRHIRQFARLSRRQPPAGRGDRTAVSAPQTHCSRRVAAPARTSAPARARSRNARV